MPDLKLYNTLTRQKEVFEPIDPDNVQMYVCGPTVYDFAHIGNARPVIVFDVLFRLLRHLYGEDKVTYVRNITDVDDKINARALRDYPDLPLNEAIRNVTEKTATQFHADVKALGCLEPTHEPRATEHIGGMVKIIQTLLDKDHAYISQGGQGREVLFRVASMKAYGQLSNRKLEDQQAGARVAVESHKENAGDFVLWKESKTDEPGWEGTFNAETIHGRPGWHIECSAMSEAFLGKTFDIHGGGLDLIFPHHENEIAQSCCAHGTDKMANIWMHNGYLQVEGKKMSKSDGNFVTIREEMRGSDPTELRNYIRSPRSGFVMRMAMLDTHYRQPINWTTEKLDSYMQELESWAHLIFSVDKKTRTSLANSPTETLIECLCDDLNTPNAFAHIRSLANLARSSEQAALELASNLEFLGLIDLSRLHAFTSSASASGSISSKELFEEIRNAWPIKVALLNNDEEEMKKHIVLFKERGIGVSVSDWGDVSLNRQGASMSASDEIEQKISQRLEALNNKNFEEADKIRDDLASQGIQLKDSKDSETGERVTTWEVKR